MAKAVSLFSGGLDSSLATVIVKGEGVQVLGVSFSTPFFAPDKAIDAASELEIPLQIIDLSQDYIDLLYNPKYGFGKNMNPCIDCHALMINRAGEYMRNIGADFIVTGEVLGSRPKSQSRTALEIVAKESGFKELILRPLSARLLNPTIAEQQGWVKRERLLDIHGRTRKRQLSLAEELGVTRFSTPAGGCLLTDPAFSRRLRDELDHEKPTVNDLQLLRFGRHFRVSQKTKVVIGRNKEENLLLRGLARAEDLILEVKDHKGPVTILRGELDQEAIVAAASLCARYSDGKDLARLEVGFTSIPDGWQGLLLASPKEAQELGVRML